MGSLHHTRIDEARKPMRDRRPLADCNQRALINLQDEWGMSDAPLFGLRLGADAVCLRSDVSVASAIANLRHTLVSAAATLAMVEEHCVDGDPSRHVVESVRQSLREGLGMLGIVNRAVDDDLGRDDGAPAIDPALSPTRGPALTPMSPTSRAIDGAAVVA